MWGLGVKVLEGDSGLGRDFLRGEFRLAVWVLCKHLTLPRSYFGKGLHVLEIGLWAFFLWAGGSKARLLVWIWCLGAKAFLVPTSWGISVEEWRF